MQILMCIKTSVKSSGQFKVKGVEKYFKKIKHIFVHQTIIIEI